MKPKKNVVHRIADLTMVLWNERPDITVCMNGDGVSAFVKPHDESNAVYSSGPFGLFGGIASADVPEALVALEVALCKEVSARIDRMRADLKYASDTMASVEESR